MIHHSTIIALTLLLTSSLPAETTTQPATQPVKGKGGPVSRPSDTTNATVTGTGLYVRSSPSSKEPAAQPRGERLGKESKQAIAKKITVAFDKAVKEHTKAGKVLAQLKPDGSDIGKFKAFASWSLGFNCLNYSAALEGLVAHVAKAPKPGSPTQVNAYLMSVSKYLAHKDARYRAVACEFLAHFPTEAVDAGLTPALGNLLNDRTFAFEGAKMDMRQMRVDMYYLRIKGGLSVADVARMTLEKMTTFHFPDQKQFGKWWHGNKDYRERLWYWSVRWRSVRSGRERLATADIAGLKPTEALRLMLLSGNSSAKVADAGLPAAACRRSSKQTPVKEGYYNSPSFPPGIIAAFVRKHSLKGVLLRILRQDAPWPEARGQAMRGLLFNKLPPVLPLALDKSDAKEIENLLANLPKSLTAAGGTQEGLAALAQAAIRLDPQRAEAILLTQLGRNVRQPNLAAELVRRTGLKHWGLIKTACRQSRDKDDVIKALGQLRTPRAAEALSEWLNAKNWEPKIDKQLGREVEYETQSLFEDFVKAAAVFNDGKPVVSKELFERSLWRGCSKGTTPEQSRLIKQHNKAVPAARAKAITQLKKFFARAATKPAGRDVSIIKNIELIDKDDRQPVHCEYAIQTLYERRLAGKKSP